MPEDQTNPATASASAPPTNPTAQYVYAIGRVEPRFPNASVQNEYQHLSGRFGADAMADRGALQTLLSQRENRFLVRELCWTLNIEGLPRYILSPSDPFDWPVLVSSLHRSPRPPDFDVVIGALGPVAPPDLCGGYPARIVDFDLIISSDYGSFVEALLKAPPLEKEKEDEETGTIDSKLVTSMQPYNLGAKDEDRAFNYLLFRHARIYQRTAERITKNFELTRVDRRPVIDYRHLIDVTFIYTHRETTFAQAYSARVDVSGKYPVLLAELSRYYGAKIG
jgi:hypothetical protein